MNSTDESNSPDPAALEETPPIAAYVPKVKQFDTGVLFVHGIGNQERGHTLVQCAEPFLGWVKRWFVGFQSRLEDSPEYLAVQKAWAGQRCEGWPSICRNGGRRDQTRLPAHLRGRGGG
ncbi:MAG: hypothetical protein EXS35_13820 [Pedosphaera sp.]|nr:hypothetical protein [Pedosphaera sp.]